MPWLIVNPDSQEARVVPITGSLTLGRSTDNDLSLPDKSLSRLHARFELDGDAVIVRDLDSTRGTTVNGAYVHEDRLQPGDTIRCGDVTLLFGEGPPPEAPYRADQPPRQARDDARDGGQTELDLPSGATVIRQAARAQEPANAVSSQERLRTLLKVSAILSSPEGIETLLERTVELLFEIMDVDRAALLILEGGALVPRVVKTARPGSKTLPAVKGPPASTSFYSRHIVDLVLENDEAILTSDAPSDVRFDDAASILLQSIRSSMCVPFRARSKALGVLYVDNITVPNRFTGEDLEFLGAFANQAAIAFENSLLYRRIEEEALQRQALLRFFPPGVIDRILQSGEGGLAATEALVTTIFSDISGFTQMSSSLGPLQVLSLLNEYFPVMADIVFAHEGTLEKYIGDALLAFWGAPFRRDDDADRAIRAAVAMQRAMRQLNARWQGTRSLQIHVGINTGPVAAGRIGSERYLQYAAIGDTTNVASRICGLAAPGEILISRSTYDRLRDRAIPLDPLEPRAVKGKAEPLQLYRLYWERM